MQHQLFIQESNCIFKVVQNDATIYERTRTGKYLFGFNLYQNENKETIF